MTEMTEQERRLWVDQASYGELLSKARHEPLGSPWFSGLMGDYLLNEMKRKSALLNTEARTAASKAAGWGVD